MRHIPVLLNETIDSLQLKPGINIIDCTLGDAGHSEAILDKTGPDGRLLGLDADVESVLRAKRNLYRYEDRVTFVHDNFLNLKKVIEETKFAPAQGILMDLGWSSQQFAERGRGFSFNPPAGGDEPLDMRYAAKSQNPNDKSQDELTASEILNTYSEVELAKIFKQYGEEDLSAEIASAVVAYRKNKKIEKTNELTEIILQVYREKLHTDKEVPWVGGIHPATKVYQALRIEVNHELEALRQALPQAVEALSQGGRLAVITFHSLEDRIVKHFFQEMENKTVSLVNKKPIVAGEEELKINPRARSAKLRVVQKI